MRKNPLKILHSCSRTGQHSNESNFPLLEGIIHAGLNGKNKCWLILKMMNKILTLGGKNSFVG